jgi:prepilin-type N-terminal cleavage/methylation domain-containing protein
MDFKTTFIKSGNVSGFTLPEVLVASGLGALVALVVVAVSMQSSRSFVAIANYVEMDAHSQLALDTMSREIRQARSLTSFTPTSLSLMDQANHPLLYDYQSKPRKLVRVSGGLTNVVLTDCDKLTFSNYQRNVISNTFDAYNPAYVADTKLIQVTWVCSRRILGAKANSESVQSAKIVLRNQNER